MGPHHEFPAAVFRENLQALTLNPKPHWTQKMLSFPPLRRRLKGREKIHEGQGIRGGKFVVESASSYTPEIII